MLEQHAYLKKLLLVLGVLLVGAVIFAAFSLYRAKVQDGLIGRPDMAQKELTGEEKIGRQLEELGKDSELQASVEEIEQQLEELAKNNEGSAPTEEELRKQLNELDNRN